MPLVNFSNPLTVFLALAIFVLVLVLGKETRKSSIVAIMLFAFIGLLVMHSVNLHNFTTGNQEAFNAITTSLLVDFVFVFLSFISYLWVDDIQAKIEKKKSIGNSLDWFWQKV